MKYFNFIFKLTILVSLFVIGSVSSQDSVDFANKLQQADQLKSSDNQKFANILNLIEPNFEQLSISQKYYFLYLKGYKAAYDGDIKKAINLYKHVEENTQNPELRYKVSYSLVNLFALKKDWLAGFNYLSNISNLTKDVSDTKVRQRGLVVAAVFYNELEQFEMSNIYVNRLIAEQVTGRNRCLMYSVKLKADLFTQKFDILENEINEAIETCKNANELVVVNILRTYLASYYLIAEKHRQIVELLETHHKDILESKYEILIVEANSLLAQAHFYLKSFDKAKYYAQEVIKQEETAEYLKAFVSSFKVLSDVYKTNEQFEEAFKYNDLYIKAQESLFEYSKAKQLAVESAKHKAAEKDNQITLLNKQNQILQLEKELTEETATFNRWLITFLTVVASILILWLLYVKRSQQRLRFLAEFDSLTKISNRAHFTQNAEEVLSFFDNSERTASLILFDLDNFKKINDTNGHLVGDEVLRLTADACKGCIRKVDIFGRVGGEEFAILLPGCEHEQAMKIAEDCRQKVNEIDTRLIGHEFEVSASFGVTDTTASGYELKDLLANADEAMYLAKRRGRNRVVQHKKED